MSRVFISDTTKKKEYTKTKNECYINQKDHQLDKLFDHTIQLLPFDQQNIDHEVIQQSFLLLKTNQIIDYFNKFPYLYIGLLTFTRLKFNKNFNNLFRIIIFTLMFSVNNNFNNFTIFRTFV